ncbi:hypothetical protein [Sphingobacterium lumbrici]|uniref:hypothetical protein n=1 Tax=Sphingobacterium lumbrici TaxID=2559600 RepID=UPI00112A0DCA|nr:hypothetical protein [Sphingobacterium lumbrici]
MWKFLLWVVAMVFFGQVYGQKSTYMLIQGGRNLGFANEGYEGSFNGYTMHFVFGRNYYDRAYLGLGVGNEGFDGKYKTNDPYAEDQKEYSYSKRVLPIYIDGRLPVGIVGQYSSIGVYVNGGYAPDLGVSYDRGFMFKGGFFYLYNLKSGLGISTAAVYGYQQLTEKKIMDNRDFQHQHFNISVGIMFK